MKKMQFCLFLLMLLLTTDCRRETTPNAVDIGVPVTCSESEEDPADSTFQSRDEESEDDHFDPNYRPRDDESDNLRGFDPIWEDDMEDNGMTRYQENYDEEGWD
ncbi:MAG: hypothetical protein IJK45_09030 [Bacteroidaceae bacterium]|nr:hypothetical protein [Bacteroidaceae bacterium]